MKKILLIGFLVGTLNGCSIIALPFKAVGAVGDVISQNNNIPIETNEPKIAYTNVKPTLEQQKAIDKMLGI